MEGSPGVEEERRAAWDAVAVAFAEKLGKLK